MDSELSRLTADVSELTGRVGSLEGSVTSIENRLTELDARIAEDHSTTMAALDTLRSDLIASNRVSVSLFGRLMNWIVALARRSPR